MTVRSCPAVIVGIGLGAAVAVASARAQAPPLPQLEDAAVLVIAYADGRTVHKPVSARPLNSWTPMFPRLPGQPSASTDLPVTAIQYRGALTERGTVRVAISVHRGTPYQREDAVATVEVLRDAPVTVDQLRAVGVAPVTLSIAPLDPARLYPPRVENETAGLEVVDVEVVSDPIPRYRVTVRNLTAQPAVAFFVASSRDGRPTLSGMQGNPDASPIIEPNGSYSFRWSAGSGPPQRTGAWAPRSHDVLEIRAVLWEDGSIEGDATLVAGPLGRYLGQRVQLERGVTILRAARDRRTPSSEKPILRAYIEKLSVVPDSAMRQAARARLRHLPAVDDYELDAHIASGLARVRTGMLDDLKKAPDEAEAFRNWLSEIVGLYEGWARRFATR